MGIAILGTRSLAQSSIKIKLDIDKPATAIPDDFCGLSYEIKVVLPDSTGKHYFSPENKSLIRAFKALGIKHLRVGGNTAERSTIPIPNKIDIDSLFAFAKAAEVKVIYTVRMEGNTPQAAAEVVRYVMDRYKDYVSCITVGNEPNKHWTYNEYLDEWKKFVAVITSSAYSSDAKFCAPSTTPQAVPWAGQFAEDIGRSDNFLFLSQHDYPAGDGDTINDSAKERTRLLSSAMYSRYQNFYNSFVPAALAKNIPFRLEEANSYGHGGAVGVSDTYAASLWALDYLYWWAYHSALGINFHAGEKVLRGLGGSAKPNVYTALTSSPDGYTILPTGYGMKAFQIGSHGRLIPAVVESNLESINLAAYAVLSSDRCIYVTLINKEFDSNGRAANVTLLTNMTLYRGEMMKLTAPSGDVTSIEGITLGGADIKEDGSWHGNWTTIPENPIEDSITINVPAATAVIVKLYSN
jgi:hypothetical protein